MADVMNKRSFLILTGPPGAGKGTVSHHLVQNHDWEQFSTGNECRRHIAQGSEIGKRIDFAIKSGKLVDDQVITQIVADWISRQSDSSKIILDGYPRTLEQARLFFDLLKNRFPDSSVRVINLKVSDDVVIERLTSRLVCSNKDCQAVYSEKGTGSLGAQRDLTCCLCGALLERRSDDTQETAKNRLKTYHEHADQLLDFIGKQGVGVVHVSAERELPEVLRQLNEILGVKH